MTLTSFRLMYMGTHFGPLLERLAGHTNSGCFSHTPLATVCRKDLATAARTAWHTVDEGLPVTAGAAW